MKLATTAFGQAELRRRLGLLLLIYFSVSGLLVILIFQQRSDVIASTKKALSAFAVLTEEQTTLTIQSAEQTLDIAETRIASATKTGAASAESIRKDLRDLLASRPFLRAINLLDEHGLLVYSSEDNLISTNFSDRAYFIRHRDHPQDGFILSAPIRSRLAAREWLIPASRPIRRADGQLAGIIVVGLVPEYIGGIWTNDKTIEDQATTLWQTDGTVMIRSPFDAQSMGIVLKSASVVSGLNAGSGEGTLRTVSLIDGQDRLVAYRRLTAYPDLGVSVTQITGRALAAWQRTAWIVALGWATAGVALAWLAAGLIRESNVRQATQERFSRIFKANPFPMLVMDKETHRILAVNDAAVAEYGWSREEALAMSANDFFAPEDLPALEAKQAEVPADSQLVRGLRHRRKDGTIFDVEMHTRALELDNHSAVLKIVENVTVRHSVEAQLRQAQKMEAVGQLTGGIAHDFNNILFVILANADSLVEEKSLPAAVTERLDGIAEAVARASALTRQLLSFSRQQTLRPQQTDLNDLVSDTGKLLRRALGARIEIEAILSEELCITNIDRSQLETALVNLCINARDAMPDGGRVLIETRNVILDQDYVVSKPGVAAGRYAMLTVTDTGSGIPPDILGKVFDPFFTTKEVGTGTGLGLSMVYGFIKQSNGHIEIYSELDVGTSFKLYLPCSGQAVEQESPLRNASQPRGDERILVVEDEALVRANVVEQLRSLGYSVSDVGDAQSCVAAFETASGAYDLLLTDVIMPGLMNGKALADEVKLRWPKTSVVFMSGFTELSAAHSGRLEKDALLLSKPFRKSELAQMVRRALDAAVVPDGIQPEAD